MPASCRGLGLPAHELERHIAYDIGAAMVARDLAARLDAPLILSGYSRLLIDCNRPVHSPTAIPAISESTVIPGNQEVSGEERQSRAARYYWPFQNAVSAVLDARTGRQTLLIAVHSFTPVFKGFVRPWHAGVLFRRSKGLGLRMVELMAEPGLTIAANEPYTISDDGDYTIPVHGEARGLEALLLELRQDLIASAEGAAAWAIRVERALRALP
jgi:predicted N-formylglutamate amidohydrolase